MTTLTEKDFTTYLGEDEQFALINMEGTADVFVAWGHREREAFLDEVMAYDRAWSSGAQERGEPSDVHHRWAVEVEDVADDDGWSIAWIVAGEPVTEQTPGAFAVTVWSR